MLRVYTSVVVKLSTGGVGLILPGVQFGTYFQNPVINRVTGLQYPKITV